MGESPDPYDVEPHDDQGAPDPADDGGGGAGVDRPSLIGDRDEACPRCGAALTSDAVLCVECGYDLRVNTVREPEAGEDVRGTDDDAERDEFVEVGRGGVKMLAILAGVVTIAAVVTAGITARPSGIGAVLRSSFLTLYNVGLHTGTGLVAVGVAAWLCEERVGRPGLAACRMFLAFASFELVRVTLSGAPGGRFYWFIGAIGVYWLVLWGLFGKKPAITLLMMLAHMVLWAVVMLGIELSATTGG